MARAGARHPVLPHRRRRRAVPEPQIGFAVAFGVLLDTVLVRSIIVPALAYDIGKKIWWPSSLAAASAKD